MAFLSFHHLRKSFPGVLALDDVSFEVQRGSCHALMGENGAGKSTLGKILAGVHLADQGEIRMEGNRIHPSDPTAARDLGIAMVHQELAFCPNLTVAENLCLGHLPQKGGWLDRRRMKEVARSMLQEIEANIDVEQPMATLTTGQEQIVQIAAAVGTHARIIVMDEPTSSLSAGESEHLFHLLAHLRERQITILYVSHRLEEIFHLCDWITVLRDGRHVSTGLTGETSPDRVIHQMIGRDVTTHEPAHVARDPGGTVLEVKNLCSPGKFDGVTFDLRQGEILGVAGLVGAGRSEVAQAIFGLDPQARGTLQVQGQPMALGSVHESMARGVGLVPEDRKRQGLVLSLNCRENTSLPSLKALTRFGFVRTRDERSLANDYASRLRIKAPSIEAATAGLSGGNQQKITLAKWLARDCRILIVDEPTRGIDVGAKAEIYQLLDELSCQGLAILMISSELTELMGLCRRILVMREGRVTGTLARDNFSQPVLMRLMAGLSQPAEC